MEWNNCKQRFSARIKNVVQEHKRTTVIFNPQNKNEFISNHE